MKIFTNDEIRQIDKYTIEVKGVSSMELINRVAEAVVSEIVSRWRPSKTVAVFAGPGNNGADALAVAALLSAHGFRQSVYLFNIGGNSLSPECRMCRDNLAGAENLTLVEVTNKFNMPELNKQMLIIDGLFGSGLKEPLQEGFAYLVQRINEAEATVVSIDIPSGLRSDSNLRIENRNVIHATLTLAIQYPRPAFFLADNAELIGEWRILDIGLNHDIEDNLGSQYYLVEPADVTRYLRPRPRFATKNDFGSAIIYAGSYGMMGAAVLAARGALRAGAGKVTVESPKCGYNVLQTSVPEALYHNNSGDLNINAIHPLQRYNAIAVGPGIGTNEATITALEEFLASNRTPVILDADALNCIALKPKLLTHIPELSIITPHVGEFDRLFGTQPSSEARLLKAIEMARYYHIMIILKGHYTAIVRPDGNVYFNSTGTPAMATAGSGDVLTGILTGFIAQGFKSEIAAIVAVLIHGLAGEIAAKEHGDYGVTAGDIADNIGRAIKMVMEK